MLQGVKFSHLQDKILAWNIADFGEKRGLYLWALPNGKLLYQLERNMPSDSNQGNQSSEKTKEARSFVINAQFIKNGARIAVIYSDQQVVIWDSQTGQPLKQSPFPIHLLPNLDEWEKKNRFANWNSWFLRPQVSPDGKYFLSVEVEKDNKNPRAYLWDSKKGNKSSSRYLH